MIKIISEEIDDFICLLEMEYVTDESFYLHICEGHDTIEDPETGKVAFGMFGIHNNHCYVAGDLPLEQLLKTIAHEYMHFIQKWEEKDINEDEAEDFADLMYNKFTCDIRSVICNCDECKFCEVKR